MAQRKRVINAFRDADDLVYLVTGRRIKNLVSRGLELFGEDLKKKVVEDPEVSEDSPYKSLGIRQDASDIVVKAAFRSLAREFHPDTGSNPNPRAFQEAKEAYDQIMREREGLRGS
jgi:DnaJ like chaperone protein